MYCIIYDKNFPDSRDTIADFFQRAESRLNVSQSLAANVVE